MVNITNPAPEIFKTVFLDVSLPNGMTPFGLTVDQPALLAEQRSRAGVKTVSPLEI